MEPDAIRWTEAADALAAGGDYAEAIGVYARALALGASTPRLHHNFGRALYEMGEVSRATRHFEVPADACDEIDPWLALATLIPGDPSASNEKILDIRRAFAARLEHMAPARAPDRPPRPPSRRIRVGYLSSWFDRANYLAPVWSLLRHLDRACFEVHLFSDTLPADMPGFTPQSDDRTHWTGLLDNGQLVGVIRACGIDILVDLNGYSAPRRLPVFLEPPAPVTLGWFNLYATSGLPGMQFIVGDPQVVRPGEEVHFSERVLRLPVSYLTFEFPHRAPPVAPPPCSTGRSLTFGSLASQYKITPEVLDCWSAILRRTGDTRLLVANNTLNTPANRAYLANRLSERGVQRERLTLLGPADHLTFLGHYARIDVALDTFPYSGGTTTMEALWQGVPVLTVEGDRWASRTTRSLLHYAGLGEFIARDAAALEDLAVALARDPASRGRLERWRVGQRRNLAASPVCDGAALGRHMARLYRALARRGLARRPTPRF